MFTWIAVGILVAALIAWFLCGRQWISPRPADPPPEQRSRRIETGSMIYFADNPHGLPDKLYRFNYRKVGGVWRAYILQMPDLRGRDASGVVTHRLYDNGQPYVCWNKPVDSLHDMQTISRVWANSLQEYIATGQRFG